ncbi:type 2 periplasmic-binding domain-containing protein [Pueribacillus theae]
MGVSLVTDLAMQQPSKGIVFRSLNPVTTIATSFAWRKDEKSPVVNTFLTLAREFLKTKFQESQS